MSKLTESARGRECTVRISCNYQPETTVGAHLNGAGMGIKHNDMFIAYCCSSCHKWLDGGYAIEGYTADERDIAHLRGVVRTQQIMLNEGLITVKGDKTKKRVEYYLNNA